MDKIPVGQTVARAYSFAFKDFLKIIGVMWLPFAIMMAGTLVLATQINVFTAAITTKNYAAVTQVVQVLLPAYVVFAILVVMQFVGLTELALGNRTGSPYFFFTLGKPLWRLIGAYLLVILIFIAAIAVFIIGSAMIAALFGAMTGATNGAKPSGAAAIVMGLGAIIGVIAAYCAFLYGLVRQTFLLTPVVIAEEKIGLRRAWSLGRGNFWRMFTILLAIIVPFIVLEMIFLFGFVWHGMPPVPPQGATKEQLAAWQAQNAANMTSLQDHWYITLPLYLIISAIFYGYICGAQSFAYRALVPAEKAEDVF
ncbi:MAG TPA: hypothetical protein VMS78_00940 [Rhizomicrobium sp.]|nr:hypothetical protein [Rhizomicrobium sp.]